MVKYLVYWKRFTAENNIWKKEEDLKNTRKIVIKFKGKLSIEVKKQEKLDLTKERDFRKGELLEKCMMKMLYE